MSEPLSSCLDVLGRVIAMAKDSPHGRNISGEIANLVVEGFDCRQLDWSLDSVKIVKASYFHGTNFVIEFTMVGEDYLFRSEFMRNAANNSWRLYCFCGACPGCFGDGILDGETCLLCDGCRFVYGPEHPTD